MIDKKFSDHYIRLLTFSVVFILSLVLIIPSFSGCSGTATKNHFLELLSLVPATTSPGEDVPVYYTLIDYTSAFQVDGITFSTLDELLSNIDKDNISYSIIGLGSYITGYGRYINSGTIKKEYVGYDVTCIDAEIQFGFPPANGVAAIGRFDPQATKNALNSQDDWPPWAKIAYTIEDHNGVTIHSWGDGFQIHLTDRLVPPHIDELGRSRPLAITDNHLFSAASVETVKVIIDASQNKIPTLADLPEYAAIANGLTDLKAYVAMAGDGYMANLCLSHFDNASNQLTEEQKEMVTSSMGTPMKKFLTFASGVGRDEKGIYTAIVIYHENPGDALENSSLLKQHIENTYSIFHHVLWSEMITDTDIKAEGNVLLARLYCDSSAFWASWVYSMDNLLFHEE